MRRNGIIAEAEAAASKSQRKLEADLLSDQSNTACSSIMALFQRTMEEREKTIEGLLSNDRVSKIVLVGDAGMGKTWIARRIINTAMNEGLCYTTLWFSLSRKYDDESLNNTIARQLSLLPSVEDGDEDDTKEAKKKKPEDLKKRITEELEKRRAAPAKYLLLILDGERNEKGSEVSELENMLFSYWKLMPTGNVKYLITRREKYGELESGRKEIEFEPLNEQNLLDLLKTMVEKNVSDHPSFKTLSAHIVQMSMGLPAAIRVIAEGLNYITRNEKDSEVLSQKLERALTEAAVVYEKADGSGKDIGPEHAVDSEAAAGSKKKITGANHLAHLACKMMQRDAVVDCFWHSLHFLGEYGIVHYTDLIANWILEGYLGPVHNIKESYENGHSVFMELIDRGLLKIQEDNFVVLEEAVMGMDNLQERGFYGTARLGLVNVFKYENFKGVWRVTQTDGMMKTLHNGGRGEKVSALLTNGSCLHWQLCENYFDYEQDIEILGLFEYRFKCVPLPSSTMDKLKVLVLRGCDLLEDISNIQSLDHLTALEISGSNSLMIIPDEVFKKISQLQSLNLSDLPIRSLPDSISNLKELRVFIVRDCFSLEGLPNLQSLTNLEVIDLHGARSLEELNKKNKSFSQLQNLKMIDLSYSKVQRLPILNSRNSNTNCLERLLLRGCDRLTILPNLKSVSGLQILDICGANKLKTITGEQFEKKDHLKILDLSETPIKNLPSNIANLCDLKLKGCTELVELSSVKALEEMKKLQVLDLSKASRLISLPSLSKLGLLRHLFLKDCSSLQNLASMEGLVSLEILDLSGCEKLLKLPQLKDCQRLELLDLSGCSALTTIDGSFECMSRLQKLNLSDTKIQRVPDLCNPSNLRYLSLRNCTELKDFSQAKVLLKLKDLDLNGVKSLSNAPDEFWKTMSNIEALSLCGVILHDFKFISILTNLTQLSLTIHSGAEIDCHLGELTKLQVLNLSETAMEAGSSVTKPRSPLTLQSIGKLINLFELSLCGCSSLESMPPLESLGHLQVLNLSGTGIKEFPYVISELACLKCLVLPDLAVIQRLDWSKIKRLPEELSWEKCSIPEPTEISAQSSNLYLQVTRAKFFEILEKNPNFWRNCFKEFYVSVCFNEQEKGRLCLRDMHAYGDIYLKTRCFPHPEKRGGFLEFRGSSGSDNFPPHVKEAISEAEKICFIDDISTSCSSMFSAFDVNEIKGCWLERCPEVEKVFCHEDGEIKEKKLEILWVSNLPKLNSVCSEKLHTDSFNNLKHLYLDCCPELESLFPPTQLPRFLETLKVKFCDKVRKLFDCTGGENFILDNLKVLYLLDLPELERVGVKLPRETEYTHRNCPKLQDTGESLKSN